MLEYISNTLVQSQFAPTRSFKPPFLILHPRPRIRFNPLLSHSMSKESHRQTKKLSYQCFVMQWQRFLTRIPVKSMSNLSIILLRKQSQSIGFSRNACITTFLERLLRYRKRNSSRFLKMPFSMDIRFRSHPLLPCLYQIWTERKLKRLQNRKHKQLCGGSWRTSALPAKRTRNTTVLFVQEMISNSLPNFQKKFFANWKATQQAAGFTHTAVFVARPESSWLLENIFRGALMNSLEASIVHKACIVSFSGTNMATKQAIRKEQHAEELEKEQALRSEQDKKRQKLVSLQSRTVRNPRGWDVSGHWLLIAPEMDNYNSDNQEFFMDFQICKKRGGMYAAFGFGYLTGVLKLDSTPSTTKRTVNFNWRGEEVESTHVSDEQVGTLEFSQDGASVCGKIWTDMGMSFVEFNGVRVGDVIPSRRFNEGETISSTWSSYLDRLSSRW
ncbi:hypothetical protein BDR26DRAFT_630553 [Obelidium mucronatum]|nr:hypothetical protein BDR26DRAFT_630553 [Obelidium mucronatum]